MKRKITKIWSRRKDGGKEWRKEGRKEEVEANQSGRQGGGKQVSISNKNCNKRKTLIKTTTKQTKWKCVHFSLSLSFLPISVWFIQKWVKRTTPRPPPVWPLPPTRPLPVWPRLRRLLPQIRFWIRMRRRTQNARRIRRILRIRRIRRIPPPDNQKMRRNRLRTWQSAAAWKVVKHPEEAPPPAPPPAAAPPPPPLKDTSTNHKKKKNKKKKRKKKNVGNKKKCYQ